MLALLALIVLAAGQTCPYCEYNACQVTSQGLGNCSACNVGALVTVTAGASYGSSFAETVGVCMVCGSNCLSCSYGPYWATMSPQYVGIYCTDCADGFTEDAITGACLACPANCLSCQDQLDYTDVVCTQCASGYTLGTPTNNFACTASSSVTNLAAPAQGKGMSGLTIGLICWGAIMTIVAIVFIALWIKGHEKRQKAPLLGSEIEVVMARS